MSKLCLQELWKSAGRNGGWQGRQGRRRQHSPPGFSLLELLVVLAVVAFGVLMLLPALARTGANSPTFQCLNNLSQLQRALAMYAADNGGQLITNGATVMRTGKDWCEGWLGWGPSTDNTNTQYLAKCALGRYLGGAVAPFKCPADKVPGPTGPRVRSYSVNGFIGNSAEGFFYGALGYRYYFRDTDFAVPGPASTFVFADEHPDSINDAMLGLYAPPAASWPAATIWEDVPASHHNGAGVLSFADGHVEVHQWLDANTKPPVTKSVPCRATGKVSPNDNRWLISRASAPR